MTYCFFYVFLEQRAVLGRNADRLDIAIAVTVAVVTVSGGENGEASR
jgi:hypothetical protein